MGSRIRVEGSAWILFALLILLLPLKWVLAAILAGVIHEGCHILVLRFLGIRIHGLAVGGRGAVLETGPVTDRQEILSALAGPVGSLLLLGLIHVFPRLALCGMVQGIYNLMPIYPLDGGRVLRCAIALLLGKRPCKEAEEGVQ